MVETFGVADGLDGFSPRVPYTSGALAGVENVPGVHVVWDRDGTPLYVGQTSTQRERLLQHLSGDRGSSVLHAKAGRLLDDLLGTEASKADIQEYLGLCTVAWRSSDDPGALKAALMAQLNPKFNELIPSVPKGMPLGGSAADALHLILRWQIAMGAQTVTWHRQVADREGSVWWRKVGTGTAPSNENFATLQRQIAEGVPTFAFIRRIGEVWRARIRQVERGDFEPPPELVPSYYDPNENSQLWVWLTDFEELPADWPETHLVFAQGERQGDLVDFKGQNSMMLVRTMPDLPPGDVGLRDSLESVLDLQAAWTSTNTAAMQERGLLVRTTVPNALRALLDSTAQTAGLAIEGKDGTGLKTRVPWVRIYSPAHAPRATNGWYVVYLFSFDGESVYLSLNQGTTEFIDGDFKPRPRAGIDARVLEAQNLLSDALGSMRPRLVPSIELADKGALGEGYEAGNVAAFKYPAGSIPDDQVLWDDLRDLLGCLSAIYEDENMADDDASTKSQDAEDVPPQFTVELVQDEAKRRGLLLDPEVIPSTVAALLSGKNVIFTGPPGTAKTTLAEAVAAAAVRAGLCTGRVLTTATSDWTTYETVGGLRPSSDGKTLEFTRGQFLSAIESNQWLVIDELNRSNFDRAFGQLFTVLSGQPVELPYVDAVSGFPIEISMEGSPPSPHPTTRIEVKQTWRVIATMNVFDKSLLFEMSFALMRRFAFIEVGAPSPSDFNKLIIGAAGGAVIAHDDLEEAVLPLLGLRPMKDLGPAIYMDMARFAQQRLTLGPIAVADLRYQLFYSYLLPQFEGIDDRAARTLFSTLRPLVGSANVSRLRHTLQTVLGVNLPNQPGPEVVPDLGLEVDEDELVE